MSNKSQLHGSVLLAPESCSYASRVDEKEQLHEYKREVGIRLKKAREAAGETQASAAIKLGKATGSEIEPSRIGNYEQGKRLPDPPVMRLLCEIYGTWPSTIYGFEEAPASKEEAVLLMKFRETDDRGRKAIQGIAESQPTYIAPDKRTKTG